MQLFRDIDPSRFKSGCVLSIGNFDGIHLGHQAIIKRVLEKSAKLNLPSVIMSFEPHPHEFFTPASTDRIMGLREKCCALSDYNPDYLYIMRFNQGLANTSAQDFFSQYLLKGLNVKSLIIGDDFRFGKMRQGNYELLKQYTSIENIELENTNTLEMGEQRISSTRIRRELQESNFESAAQLLGRHFYISGRVVHGDKRGRELGFPTLNIRLKRNRILVSGVFAVEIHGLEQVRKGVANLGYRPTVQGKRPLLEVNIFDFDQQCYAKQVKVIFKHKIRDEIHFDSISQLRLQIQKDVFNAHQLLNS